MNAIARTLERPAPRPPEWRALSEELRDLYDEIADLLDRDCIEALPGYFVEECLYQVISRENHDQGLPAATLYCDGARMLRDRVLAIINATPGLTQGEGAEIGSVAFLTAVASGSDRMLRDRVLALRETQVYGPRHWRHFVSGARVLQVEDGVIHATANVMVTEAMSDAVPTILLVGRYNDRLVRRDGRLWFVERSVIYDNYRVVRSLIAPV